MSLPVLTKELRIHPAQKDFLESFELYRGFVGGRGAGKTWIGAWDMIRRAKRGRHYMVIAPTYTMMEDSSMRTFLEQLEFVGRPFSQIRSRMGIKLANDALVFFRSADNPERLRGPNLSGIWLDEASLMDQEAYNICIASLREAGEAGWLSATFTPKGVTHWTYEVFNTEKPNTRLIRCPTTKNPFLSDQFISAIQSQYSDRTALQELEGEFVDSEGAEWPASHFGPHIWWEGEWRPLAMRTIAVDPSKGRDARQGDYSAVVQLGKGVDGHLYCDADMVRCSAEVLVDLVLERQKTFRAEAIAVEANQFQELLAVQIAEKARAAGFPVPVVPVINSVSKQVRIRRLGPYLAQKSLRFRTNSHGCKTLVEQLRDFPTAPHDDGPDALEMALRVMIEQWNGKQATVARRIMT